MDKMKLQLGPWRWLAIVGVVIGAFALDAVLMVPTDRLTLPTWEDPGMWLRSWGVPICTAIFPNLITARTTLNRLGVVLSATGARGGRLRSSPVVEGVAAAFFLIIAILMVQAKAVATADAKAGVTRQADIQIAAAQTALMQVRASGASTPTDITRAEGELAELRLHRRDNMSDFARALSVIYPDVSATGAETFSAVLVSIVFMALSLGLPGAAIISILCSAPTVPLRKQRGGPHWSDAFMLEDGASITYDEAYATYQLWGNAMGASLLSSDDFMVVFQGWAIDNGAKPGVKIGSSRRRGVSGVRPVETAKAPV